MLYTKSFINTLREDPKIAECISHKFLLKGGFLMMVSSGIYAYLPLGYRVLMKISAIIRKHMNACGAQELLMSALQPIEIWQKTGRDRDLNEVMFTFKDRKDKNLCLGHTHEEEVTEIVKHSVFSYKQLPFILYQIQTKFRDEPRPRFGLMRSCEFLMKDAYSFDKDELGLAASYDIMFSAYKDIFTECGLKFVITEADPGAMGGGLSHEFMVPAEIGEDLLYSCFKCKRNFQDKALCPDCGKQTQELKTIEVGHVFQLGTKYSLSQQAFFLDEKGRRHPIIMGCYGIGVSRILSAAAETNSDDKGLIWPESISPYDATVIILDNSLNDKALEITGLLEKAGVSVLVDDRQAPPGVKFNDAYLIGNPYIVIMGKNYKKTKKFDIEMRRERESLSLNEEETLNFFKR
ncbi:MAG: proline--tRNA ligase [Candidatus Omnitrophota bacterium]